MWGGGIGFVFIFLSSCLGRGRVVVRGFYEVSFRLVGRRVFLLVEFVFGVLRGSELERWVRKFVEGFCVV